MGECCIKAGHPGPWCGAWQARPVRHDMVGHQAQGTNIKWKGTKGRGCRWKPWRHGTRNLLAAISHMQGNKGGSACSRVRTWMYRSTESNRV
ncbi:hypothetical protein IG631_01220 [Alternaria alternata]|nr:hypothetical protein IG631_01220 [Alternaria alternata]